MNPKLVQQVIAYASIVMAVLTQALNGIHMSPVASAILGIFGVLLHPQTSITSTEKPTVNASGSSTKTGQQTPVQGL